MRQEGYLDLLLGFQLGWNGTLLEGKLARGGDHADEPLEQGVPLVAEEKHELPLGALELHLQAHLQPILDAQPPADLALLRQHTHPLSAVSKRVPASSSSAPCTGLQLGSLVSHIVLLRLGDRRQLSKHSWHASQFNSVQQQLLHAQPADHADSACLQVRVLVQHSRRGGAQLLVPGCNVPHRPDLRGRSSHEPMQVPAHAEGVVPRRCNQQETFQGLIRNALKGTQEQAKLLSEGLADAAQCSSEM